MATNRPDRPLGEEEPTSPSDDDPREPRDPDAGEQPRHTARAAAPVERDAGAHAEQVTDQANLRADPSPPPPPDGDRDTDGDDERAENDR